MMARSWMLSLLSLSACSLLVDLPAPACGNGVIDQGFAPGPGLEEECDLGDQNSDTGACSTSCQIVETVCGDGIKNGAEDCDSTDLGGLDCAGVDGFGAGTLACASDCTFDTSQCEPLACGDNITSLGEGCDDGNLIDNDGCDADCQPSAVEQLGAGDFHTCAVLRTGAVRCWGFGGAGRLGYGNLNNIGDNETPASAGDVQVTGADDARRVIQVAGGNFHTCALLDDGAVRCWGESDRGQLGYGNQNDIGDNELPFVAGDVNLGGPATQIALGNFHTCALLESGTVRCWGENDQGRLGYDITGNNNLGDNAGETPAASGDVPLFSPQETPARVLQVVAGVQHTCALLEGGRVRCWGDNGAGQLGYGNTTIIGDDERPFAAGDVPVGARVIQLAAGDFFTCALLEDGAVRCWGDNIFGQLGYGNTSDIGDDETPASAGDVALEGTATQITARFSQTCALLEDGAVRCWGDANRGQLGYGNLNDIGDNEDPASAGDVNVGASVQAIAAGFEFVCVLTTEDKARCWGKVDTGILGYGPAVNQDIGDNEDPASAGDIPLF